MEQIIFKNDIHYLCVSPEGEIISQGDLTNVTGYRTRDMVLRCLSAPVAANSGTLIPVEYMYFRTDGKAALGSFTEWNNGNGTVLSTRLVSSGSYLTGVRFDATYTATANVSVKAAILTNTTQSAADDIGSFAQFWSTNFNMACGNGGKLIIQWTVSIP